MWTTPHWIAWYGRQSNSTTRPIILDGPAHFPTVPLRLSGITYIHQPAQEFRILEWSHPRDNSRTGKKETTLPSGIPTMANDRTQTECYTRSYCDGTSTSNGRSLTDDPILRPVRATYNTKELMYAPSCAHACGRSHSKSSFRVRRVRYLTGMLRRVGFAMDKRIRRTSTCKPVAATGTHEYK